VAAAECTDWDGVTTRDVYKPAIVTARDGLADAARSNDWVRVLEALETRSEWVNATRLGSRSGYAPLHQAAWHGADREVVLRLLDLGAWRMLRTSSGERPADIAMARGHAHLADLLEPVVIQQVPAGTLAALERRFHVLIEEVTDGLAARLQLKLPQLEILTELSAGSRVQFPVPGMYGGFSFWLEEDALIVESWSRVVGGSGKRHRIDADGTTLLEAGFV
jgi:hypothetical protein